VCNSCSPTKLLVPWGQQIEDAPGYDKSLPQRVCLHCSSELHPLQAELVYHYARANQENPHEPRGGRFHLPYTSSLAVECCHAGDILSNFTCEKWGASADRGIPLAILEKARGLAILTVVKAGFMFVGKIGTGLVVSRLPDGSWSAPSAIGTIGLGWGLQIGGELVEIVLVLGSDAAVQVFHKPQVNLGAGLDITIGPVGRAASAAGAVSSVGVNANYGYSHSRGLYAGLALQGTVIVTRTDLNRKFYGRELEPSDLLSGSVGQPTAAKPLYDALAGIDEALNENREVLAERAAMMGPCRACECQTYVAHTTQAWNKKCKDCDHMH
jgi:lipid-binding SYLF domain-containing protein